MRRTVGRSDGRTVARSARRPTVCPSGRLTVWIWAAWTLLVPVALQAQGSVETQLRTNQQRLEEIKRERDKLQDDLQQIRSRVHNITSELVNLEGQKRVTGS